jgi:hypothetical protein
VSLRALFVLSTEPRRLRGERAVMTAARSSRDRFDTVWGAQPRSVGR